MQQYISSTEYSSEIYYGSRKEDFRQMIRGVFLSAPKNERMKETYIDGITTEECMKLYGIAFTHPTADLTEGQIKNYDSLELAGDATANCAIVWYMRRRFPQLCCAKGVKVLARLKINYVSKKVFHKIAEEAGFWPYISANDETRSTKMKKLLTDVLESFIAATQVLLDSNFGYKDKDRDGIGYPMCAKIIKIWYDRLDISLRYEDLYDPITRLKEVFDRYKKSGDLSCLKYEAQKVDRIQNVSVSGVIKINGRNQRMVLGKGSAAKKADADQKAAGKALIVLKNMGYSKPVPPEYAAFQSQG